MGSVQEYTVDQERSKVLSAFWKRNGFAYQFTFSGKQKKKKYFKHFTNQVSHYGIF